MSRRDPARRGSSASGAARPSGRRRRETEVLAGEELAGALGGREIGIGMLQGVPMDLEKSDALAPSPVKKSSRERTRPRGKRRTP